MIFHTSNYVFTIKSRSSLDFFQALKRLWVKKNSSSPYLTKTNDVFLSILEYLFFVSEIFTFLYYANEESDYVINSSS